MAGEANESLERVMSRKSWDEFCDTLKAAGQIILADGSPDNWLRMEPDTEDRFA